jgi:cobalamin biosynthesis protein CobT
MSGSKFDMACAGAGSLAEALKPINIAYSIYGFTNTVENEDPIVWLFTEFGERVSQAELIKRFDKVSGGLWQNSDGDAIAYATARLSQRKEHRKVLLVLSDGSPAGRDHAGDVEAYTLKTVQHAENIGIDVYGIGIMDTNVTRFYKKNVVVNDLANLSGTILSIIDRSI